MSYEDKDFQSHKQRLFFEYLAKKCPQFGLFYASPEICPKGYLQIYVQGLFGQRLIATIVASWEDGGYYIFEPFVSRKNRQAVIEAIQNAPADCHLDLQPIIK